MKDEVGADFTIMPPYVLPPMGSSWPSGTVFPPRPQSAISNFRSPNSRRSSGPADRVRPERHNPHSIATLRISIARVLIRQLPCCPFVGQNVYNTVVLEGC